MNSCSTCLCVCSPAREQRIAALFHNLITGLLQPAEQKDYLIIYCFLLCLNILSYRKICSNVWKINLIYKGCCYNKKIQYISEVSSAGSDCEGGTLLENIIDDAILLSSIWRNFRPLPSIWLNLTSHTVDCRALL